MFILEHSPLVFTFNYLWHELSKFLYIQFLCILIKINVPQVESNKDINEDISKHQMILENNYTTHSIFIQGNSIREKQKDIESIFSFYAKIAWDVSPFPGAC